MSNYNIMSNGMIKEIINIAKTKQIIAIGEVTHGQKLITDFRIKLFKKLVRECDYKVFVLEVSYFAAKLINEYISKGIGCVEAIVLNHFGYPYGTKEIINLIYWMRENYSKYGLEFMGLDCQYLLSFYKIGTKIDREILKIHNENMRTLNKRDRNMARIFKILYKSNKKYFLYFHNHHIMRREGSMGNYLKKYKYYVIGNIFFTGNFTTFDNIITYKSVISTFLNKHKILKTGFYDKNINNIEYSTQGYLAGQEYTEKVKNNEFNAILVINNEKPLKWLPPTIYEGNIQH